MSTKDHKQFIMDEARRLSPQLDASEFQQLLGRIPPEALRDIADYIEQYGGAVLVKALDEIKD